LAVLQKEPDIFRQFAARCYINKKRAGDRCKDEFRLRHLLRSGTRQDFREVISFREEITYRNRRNENDDFLDAHCDYPGTLLETQATTPR
jgi:hypothetical protein